MLGYGSLPVIDTNGASYGNAAQMLHGFQPDIAKLTAAVEERARYAPPGAKGVCTIPQAPLKAFSDPNITSLLVPDEIGVANPSGRSDKVRVLNPFGRVDEFRGLHPYGKVDEFRGLNPSGRVNEIRVLNP